MPSVILPETESDWIVRDQLTNARLKELAAAHSPQSHEEMDEKTPNQDG